VSPLRLLTPADLPQLVAVYREAVLSQTPTLYSAEQVQAWAHHAGSSDALVEPLLTGYGLASLGSQTGAEDALSIEAFGILHPEDRLALLYCRGRSSRQGRAGTILSAMEHHRPQRGLPPAAHRSQPALQTPAAAPRLAGGGGGNRALCGGTVHPLADDQEPDSGGRWLRRSSSNFSRKWPP